jgi:hypothetical protein
VVFVGRLSLLFDVGFRLDSTGIEPIDRLIGNEEFSTGVRHTDQDAGA